MKYEDYKSLDLHELCTKLQVLNFLKALLQVLPNSFREKILFSQDFHRFKHLLNKGYW